MKDFTCGVVLIFSFFTFEPSVQSCSILMRSASDGAYMGKNLDWDFGHGLLIANPRGLIKTAIKSGSLTPARWTSKYGSITFNQVAREMPYGGLNEKGLDVEALWLRSSVFPTMATEPTVNELQWIQYQLDTYTSVQEVIDNVGKPNVVKQYANLHYFACDGSGDCAIIEPIDGKFMVYHRESLPLPALTNDTYVDSIRYSESLNLSAKAAKPPLGVKSLARFGRLSWLLKTIQSNISLKEQIFSDLLKVANPVSNDDDAKTQWATVTDLTHQTIYYKTANHPVTRMIYLSKFDFNCHQPAKTLDIDTDEAGDVTARFSNYTDEKGSSIVTKSLVTGFVHLPQAIAEKVVHYVDTMKCAEQF